MFFSPHKFLGGPGSSGVLIFNKNLYKTRVPDNLGGGTVSYTNPWGEHNYFDDVETREDGGTPAFLQTIRIALAIQLKEKMGIDYIGKRESEINTKVFKALEAIPSLKILAPNHQKRLSIFSFYLENIHFNLVVQLLNDRFGIQSRGGCSCAGTYGHLLLNIDQEFSQQIKNEILTGCLVRRPGWVRVSFHPANTDEEIDFFCNSITELVENIEDWSKDYKYNAETNEYNHILVVPVEREIVKKWFSIEN